MIYVGIDPSFSKTGMAFLDIENKIITFDSASPPGKNETYKDAIDRASFILSKFASLLERDRSYIVIYEEPLFSSMKASRLGILSGMIAFGLAALSNISEIYTINPSVIASTGRSVGKTIGEENRKKVSIYIVEQVLEYLKSIGYSVKINNEKLNKDGSMKERKISHDESEAFMMLLELLKNQKVLDTDVMRSITLRNPGLLKPHKVNYLKG